MNDDLKSLVEYRLEEARESIEEAVLLLEGVSGTASVELNEESELRLTELFEDQGDGQQLTLLDLAIGKMLITSKKLRSEKSKFRVKTPTSIIGVRGTTFSISVEADGEY